ncbi:hypothetical protein R3I94_005177 [Phoxinus phoxinus]
MFHLILLVGFLCFSVGESTTTGSPITTELTADTTESWTMTSAPSTQQPGAPITTELTAETTENWTMTSAPSTQQPGPSIITGLRIAVKSVVDLSNNPYSLEMELIVRQIESFIPPQQRATTSITVRKVQRGSSKHD